MEPDESSSSGMTPSASSWLGPPPSSPGPNPSSESGLSYPASSAGPYAGAAAADPTPLADPDPRAPIRGLTWHQVFPGAVAPEEVRINFDDDQVSQWCDICLMYLNGPLQYHDHIRGKKCVKNRQGMCATWDATEEGDKVIAAIAENPNLTPVVIRNMTGEVLFHAALESRTSWRYLHMLAEHMLAKKVRKRFLAQMVLGDKVIRNNRLVTYRDVPYPKEMMVSGSELTAIVVELGWEEDRNEKSERVAAAAM